MQSQNFARINYLYMNDFEEVVKRNMMPLRYAFSKIWRNYYFTDACLRIIHKGYGLTNLKNLECQIWEEFSSRLSTLNGL